MPKATIDTGLVAAELEAAESTSASRWTEPGRIGRPPRRPARHCTTGGFDPTPTVLLILMILIGG